MSFGDIVYIIVAVLFSYMTFVIVRNNFLSKFNDKGIRKDLVEEEKKETLED